jgi:hypothetical protein
MPILLYFVVVGTSLLGLLFGIDAALPPGKPAFTSSNFYGLPPEFVGRGGLAAADWTPAPAPDMSSPMVLAAAPDEPPAPVVAAAPAKRKKQRIARKPPEPNRTAPDRDRSEPGWGQASWGGQLWRDHYASDWQGANRSFGRRGFP